MIKKKDEKFRFKQFSIKHDRSIMKVGTDAVLLGAWVSVKNSKRILDIGTGSGVIALLLAQRTELNVKIDAIEKSEESAQQARENAAHSPWPEKISVHHTSLQEWNSNHQYDLIVCNPPFFSNSLLPPHAGRIEARHSITLTALDLLTHSKKLLTKDGRLALILPFVEGNQFEKMASAHGLFVIRQLAFFSRECKPQERWLYEFCQVPFPKSTSSLILYKQGNIISDEYRQLTSDFYL